MVLNARQARYGGNVTHETLHNHIRFAVHVFGINSDYAWEEGRHLFVMAAYAALEVMCAPIVHNDIEILQDPRTQEQVAALLSSMASAMQTSVSRSYRNCGAYVALPWLNALSDVCDIWDRQSSTGTPQFAAGVDRKSTRLNSSHSGESRMPSSA